MRFGTGGGDIRAVSAERFVSACELDAGDILKSFRKDPRLLLSESALRVKVRSGYCVVEVA